MKKKAQKFSFVMMIIFFLTGIAMTIVAAVTIGTGFGTVSSSSSSLWDYGSTSVKVNPFAKYVFPTILCGLVGTFSITAVWWAVLEHFKNVEKGLDQICRSNSGKEELPDSAYSYVPAFAASMANRPQVPAAQQPQYQPYPRQYAPSQPAQPIQQQPVQPTAPAPAPVAPTPAPAAPAPTAPAPTAPAPAPAAQASADWVCSNCGTSNNADANFCLGCGHKKD